MVLAMAEAPFKPVTQEKRQQGSMLLVHDEDRVFALQDVPKREMAAGVSTESVNNTESKFNTFAGGKQDGETLHTSTTREVVEEVVEAMMGREPAFPDEFKTEEARISAFLGDKLDGLENFQSDPFVAGQIKLDKGRIDEFAVSVVRAEYQALPWEMKTLLKHLVAADKGRWFNIADIVSLSDLPENQGEANQPALEAFRPQFITAVTLLHLEKMGNDRGAVKNILTGWNQTTISQLEAQAAADNLVINNGTFESSGVLKSDLDLESKKYLLPNDTHV